MKDIADVRLSFTPVRIAIAPYAKPLRTFPGGGVGQDAAISVGLFAKSITTMRQRVTYFTVTKHFQSRNAPTAGRRRARHQQKLITPRRRHVTLISCDD